MIFQLKYLTIMIYKNLEVKQTNYKKILLNILVIIILFIGLIYIYISNNSTNSNTRRKINLIEKDITQLYNYTETMSDFIVDNYKPPEINLKILFEDIYKNQLDLKKDNEILKNSFEKFKNQSLRNHLELKDEIIEIKNKEKELNKNFIRKSAIEYLNKYYGLFNNHFNKYYNLRNSIGIDQNTLRCILININKNYNKLYEELLNIDYDNYIVSFAYFSENYEENFKQHPLYNLIINNNCSAFLNDYYMKYFISFTSVSPQKFM